MSLVVLIFCYAACVVVLSERRWCIVGVSEVVVLGRSLLLFPSEKNSAKLLPSFQNKKENSVLKKHKLISSRNYIFAGHSSSSGQKY